MKVRLVFLFLLFFVFNVKADIGSDIANILNGTINTSPTVYRQVGERGYVGLGSISYRMNTSNMSIQPFSVSPPSVKIGCGAIDVGFGGVNFLGFEYLVQKLQSILQAAPAFAFQLALEVFAPQVANVLAQINAIADAINSINFSACDASRVIHAIAPTVRDAVMLGKTDYASSSQADGSSSGFWDSIKNAFQQTDFYRRISDAWNNIVNSSNNLRNIFSSGTGSFSGEACVFPSNSSGVGALVSGQFTRYLFKPLKYVSSDAYALKKNLLGNYCVSATADGYTKTFSAPDLKFTTSYKKAVSQFISENSSLLAAAVNSGLQSGSYSNFSCTGQSKNIDGTTYDFSYVCNLMNGIGRSVVDYYVSIRDNRLISSTSANYINFIASVNSGYVRLIRNAALLNRREIVSAISSELVESIMEEVIPAYMYEVASEGCMEAEVFLRAMAEELSKVSIDNTNKASANVSINQTIQEIKNEINNVRTFCSSYLSVIGSKDSFEYVAGKINSSQTLLEAVKATDNEIANNLKNRGLDVLFKYTSNIK